MSEEQQERRFVPSTGKALPPLATHAQASVPASQQQDSYDSAMYDFCEAVRTLRSNTRAITYDSSNHLTNCSDYFNAYCLLNNGRPVSTRGHKHLLNEVIDITTDGNNEEIRTPLTDILDSKASVIHTHDISEITKTTITINEEEEEEVVETLSDLLDGKANVNHNHDSSYSAINHNHSYNDLTDKLDLGNYSAQIPRKSGEGWNRYFKVGQGNNIISCSINGRDAFGVDRSCNVSCEGTITANNVNINTALDNKADVNHNHDTSYSAINHNHDTSYSAINHNHDISEITKTTLNEEEEVVETLSDLLDDKASINHNHDSSYSAINHNHDSSYSALNHNHDSTYSAINHNHDSTYSAINHNHDSSYSAINHTHTSNDITDLDNEIDLRFRLILADLIYPVGIIVCFYQSLETLGATVWTRNPLVYQWNYMLWEFLPDDVFIRNGFKNNNNKEDGAEMTPAGSDTHTHTTSGHTLTVDEIPSHNHQVRGSYNNQLTGNGENCIGLSLWGDYATYENTNNNGYGYIGLTGGGQSHSHGNTGSASNIPKHVVAYFYKRI